MHTVARLSTLAYTTQRPYVLALEEAAQKAARVDRVLAPLRDLIGPAWQPNGLSKVARALARP